MDHFVALVNPHNASEVILVNRTSALSTLLSNSSLLIQKTRVALVNPHNVSEMMLVNSTAALLPNSSLIDHKTFHLLNRDVTLPMKPTITLLRRLARSIKPVKNSNGVPPINFLFNYFLNIDID